MPVNFALVSNLTVLPQKQSYNVGILQQTAGLGRKDESKGRIAAMAAEGIDPRPGTPSISDKTIVFVVNGYFSVDVPGATADNPGYVLEVLLEQKFYAVMCLCKPVRGFGPPENDWPPFAVKVIGAPRDLKAIQLNPSPSRPTAPLADLGIPSGVGPGALRSNPYGVPIPADPYGVPIPYIPDTGSTIYANNPGTYANNFGRNQLPVYRPLT